MTLSIFKLRIHKDRLSNISCDQIHNKIKYIKIKIIAFLLITLNCWSADYYVDANNGNDSSLGSKSLPLKTISAGINKAHAGDTVWILSGTYRETINLNKSGLSEEVPISIRAVSDSEVKVKGSDRVTDWKQYSGSIWKRTNWETNSQQVFVDDVPLKQIGNNCPYNEKYYDGHCILPNVGEGIVDMHPGTFWYDSISETIYIWLVDNSNPNNHVMEASVRDFIIPPNDVSFIEIHDLNFFHSNLTHRGLQLGMVNICNKSWIVSGNTFNYGDFAGISIIGEGHRITNNIFNYNGNCGIYISGSGPEYNWNTKIIRSPQNIFLEKNETSFNNYRGYNISWAAGGLKASTSCNGIEFSQHIATSNNGPGIWIDGWCKNMNIKRCIVKNNSGAGIFYEISDEAVIMNNLVANNLTQGIYVSASNAVSVFNNTVVNNWAGIVLHGMPRQEHPTLNNNVVRNNILSENQIVDLVIYTNPSEAVGNSSDYNLYYRSDRTIKISWTNRPGYEVNYTNLDLFIANTGQDQNSLNGPPMWINVDASKYTLQSNSPAIDSGTIELPKSSDKDLNGLSRVVDGNNDGIAEIDIGAYEFQIEENKPLAPPSKFRVID